MSKNIQNDTRKNAVLDALVLRAIYAGCYSPPCMCIYVLLTGDGRLSPIEAQAPLLGTLLFMQVVFYILS